MKTITCTNCGAKFEVDDFATKSECQDNLATAGCAFGIDRNRAEFILCFNCTQQMIYE